MKQRNTEARREMLIERRFRQRAREAGFTPMPNKRLNKAIQEHFAVLLAADIARRNGRGTPDVAEMAQRNTEAKGSNPFLKPARRETYDAALAAGKTRNEAMKIARRVPA